MKFYKTPSLIRFLFNKCVWRLPANEKIIYPTFDDGPQPGLTEFILDTLENFRAKGTFFCVGDNIRKYPSLAARIIENGHTIGNHTFNHLQGWKTNDEDYFKNVEKFEECANKYLPKGRESNLFRPPHGQISFRQIKKMHQRGYHVIMWDVLSYDFVKNLDCKYALGKIKKATRPGTIVLFHDNYKAEENIRYLLPKYLDYFAGRNYRFSSIDL